MATHWKRESQITEVIDWILSNEPVEIVECCLRLTLVSAAEH